jgi:Domain of unknown function (DUF397)
MASTDMRRPESAPAWRTASFCQSGECAEVAEQGGEVLLRSTRAPDVVVRLTGTEWQALTKGIAAGEFSELGLASPE